MTVFITLEPYLVDWIKHESGNEYPLRVHRGSAESDILERYLTKPPRRADYVPQLKPNEGEVEIEIPWFRHKDIRDNNYLPPRAKDMLHSCIRNRFVVQLWKDLHTIGNVVERVDRSIEDWMAAHGIQYTERNWNTIAKILQRKRAAYYKNHRLTNKKTSLHRKRRDKGTSSLPPDAPGPMQ